MNKSFECPHFPRCSGCSQTKDVDQPPILAEIQTFFPDFQLHVGAITGWRTRAKLAVRGTAQIPLVGLYREGTHDIINIPFCKVHHPKINDAVAFIKQWIREEGIEPYNETTFTGMLRYLQLSVEQKTGKIQLVLVANDPEIQNKLAKFDSPMWHSVWINVNQRRDNVVFGSEWILCKGHPWLWEKIAGAQVAYHPSSFVQANLEAFEQMVLKIQKWIQPNESVAEYYAGVGVIGLALVSQCKQVRCSEINQQAEACFQESKKRASPESQSKISFKTGASKEHLDWLQDVETVVVDPPRKGLEKAVLEALISSQKPKKLIYVSCGWPAFKRDCEALVEGGWKVKETEGYLFFPGTNQVETLTLFQRD